MNMNMKKSLAWGSILLALGMSTAMAGVINSTQKGSLLVFPDIDTSDAKNTVIRITNDQSKKIDVKCYYGEFTGNPYNKPTMDFQFPVTQSQPVYWSVNDGVGNIDAPPFDGKTGELKCWAVDQAGLTQVKFNHLSGTATVLDQGDRIKDPEALLSGNEWDLKRHGGAYEYSAYASACRVTGVDKVPCGPAGELLLDGTTYDQCGTYIIGSFTPRGGFVDGKGAKHIGGSIDGDFSYGRTVQENNFLNVASCTQDLSPTDGTAVPVVHKIVFEVWNENEAKRTGASEIADSWWRMDLGGNGTVDHNDVPTSSAIDSNKQHFTKAGLTFTDGAYFRAQSYAGPSGVAVGLLGEMVRDYGKLDKSAVETSHAGARAGSIKWFPESETLEKK